MPSRTPRFANWHLYALAAVAAVVIALAVTDLGTPTSSARTSREVVTAEDGVVQTTVSATGNVEPATDQTVDFATGGTLQSVDVSVGQHVKKGQLLATLDPTSADLALDQAKADLTAARDTLRAAREGKSTSSGSTGSGSSGSGSSTEASIEQSSSSTTEFVDYTAAAAETTTTPTTPTGTTTFPTGTSPTKKKKKKKRSGFPTTTGTTGTTTRSPSSSTGTSGTGTSGTGGTTTTGSSTSTKPSKAQIAQDRASVDQAKATVDSDEQTLASTRLYAPVAGTIATLESVSPGQSISAGGSSSSSSSSSNSSSSNSTGSTGSTTAGSLGSSSSNSSSSSGSGFAEIINSSTLTMTVAFSESDISSIHVGQAATISIDALSGVELGAHVTSISPVATTSSSVVSYDATLTLDQTNPKVRAGMSASASVITAQAQGVTVPNQAISGSGSTGTVQLQEGGKTVSQQVVVGVRGSSRSQIISGLRAGQQVVVTETLPALGTSSSSSSSSSGTLGSGRSLFGGSGGFPGGGGGGGFPGGGGGAFLGRGGG